MLLPPYTNRLLHFRSSKSMMSSQGKTDDQKLLTEVSRHAAPCVYVLLMFIAVAFAHTHTLKLHLTCARVDSMLSCLWTWESVLKKACQALCYATSGKRTLLSKAQIIWSHLGTTWLSCGLAEAPFCSKCCTCVTRNVFLMSASNTQWLIHWSPDLQWF